MRFALAWVREVQIVDVSVLDLGTRQILHVTSTFLDAGRERRVVHLYPTAASAGLRRLFGATGRAYDPTEPNFRSLVGGRLRLFVRDAPLEGGWWGVRTREEPPES